MARPVTPHRGFLIPNAGRAGERRLSEPDEVDFNTLGNDRWGVIEGCEVVCSGTTALMFSGGRAIVDNQLVLVSVNQSMPIPVGSVAKYALIGVDAAGTMRLIDGVPDEQDPVFPEVPVSITVLASVYCPAGASDLTSYVIDKRTILQSTLHGIAGPDVDFIRNQNGSVVEAWAVRGDGQIRWGGPTPTGDAIDTYLYRSAPNTITVQNTLSADNLVSNTVKTGTVVAGGTVTSANLSPGSPTSVPPDTAGLVIGAILQDPADGEVYILRMDTSTPPKRVWQRLAVSDEIIPAGTILQSLRDPSEMVLEGWVQLNGQTITEALYPSLFRVNVLKKLARAGTPRTMTLPNATNRVLKTVTSNAGLTGGSASHILTEANMPAHDHNVRSNPAGVHGHAISVNNGVVTGGGYDYYGAEAPVIIAAWGGRNKLDALFNDRSHTYSCEPALLRKPQYSNVSASIGGAGDHFHSMTESIRGSGTAFNVESPYLTVYTYIRL